MFSVGEHIIHPGQGVCTVMGYEDAPSPMIVLEAKSGHARTRLMYPVSQLDRLHPIIRREQAEALIADYDSLECDPYTERNSSLEETYFKKQLKLGAPETLRVVKTMRRRIRDAEERSKKPSSLLHARAEGGQAPFHRGVRRRARRERGRRRRTSACRRRRRRGDS